MDSRWLDRNRIDRETDAIDFTDLSYDADLGRYCFRNKPYTGIVVQRYPDGKLSDFSELTDGLAAGVSVGWYPNGQIQSYSELEHDMRHGLYLRWAEDGTRILERRYQQGRLASS